MSIYTSNGPTILDFTEEEWAGLSPVERRVATARMGRDGYPVVTMRRLVEDLGPKYDLKTVCRMELRLRARLCHPVRAEQSRELRGEDSNLE